MMTGDVSTTAAGTGAGVQPDLDRTAEVRRRAVEASIFHARAEALIRNESLRALLGDAVRQHIDDLIQANAEQDAAGHHHDISPAIRQLGLIQRALNSGFQGYQVRFVAEHAENLGISVVRDEDVDPRYPGRLKLTNGQTPIDTIHFAINQQRPHILGHNPEEVLEQTGYSVQVRVDKARLEDGRVSMAPGNGVRMFLGETGECYSRGTMNTGRVVFVNETNYHHDLADHVNAAFGAINRGFYSENPPIGTGTAAEAQSLQEFVTQVTQ